MNSEPFRVSYRLTTKSNSLSTSLFSISNGKEVQVYIAFGKMYNLLCLFQASLPDFVGANFCTTVINLTDSCLQNIPLLQLSCMYMWSTVATPQQEEEEDDDDDDVSAGVIAGSIVATVFTSSVVILVLVIIAVLVARSPKLKHVHVPLDE